MGFLLVSILSLKLFGTGFFGTFQPLLAISLNFKTESQEEGKLRSLFNQIWYFQFHNLAWIARHHGVKSRDSRYDTSVGHVIYETDGAQEYPSCRCPREHLHYICRLGMQKYWDIYHQLNNRHKQKQFTIHLYKINIHYIYNSLVASGTRIKRQLFSSTWWQLTLVTFNNYKPICKNYADLCWLLIN